VPRVQRLWRQPVGFKLPLGLKDSRLLLQVAEQTGVPMPLASLSTTGLSRPWRRGWTRWVGLASRASPTRRRVSSKPPDKRALPGRPRSAGLVLDQIGRD
jgi:hypothetical protein